MAPKAEKKPAKKVAVMKAGAGGKPKRAASKSETYKVFPQQLHRGTLAGCHFPALSSPLTANTNNKCCGVCVVLLLLLCCLSD